MESCPACEKRLKQGLTGHYDASCLECCARLVKTTRPLRVQAECMLGFIERFASAPLRKDILRRLKEII